MKVIITIPAFNEEKTLGPVLEEIKKVMQTFPDKYQLLVVDDGSVDNTSQVARQHGAYVVRNKSNQGLAFTFSHEMEQALKLGADIIVHTDADGQYPAKYIPLLIEKVQEGYDLVLGSRFHKGKYTGSLTKRLGNIIFARVFSNLLKLRITDTTTGFRAFTPEVARLPLINNFTYTQEQLIRAGRKRMKIYEVPITTKKTRPSRLFKNPLGYAIKAWINILRIYRDFEPLRFFGRIGISFIIAGFILGFYILYHIITLGSAGGIPRVILSMLLILVGVQISLFGFLADMIKQ